MSRHLLKQKTTIDSLFLSVLSFKKRAFLLHTGCLPMPKVCIQLTGHPEIMRSNCQPDRWTHDMAEVCRSGAPEQVFNAALRWMETAVRPAAYLVYTIESLDVPAFRTPGAERKLVRIQYSSRCCNCRSLLSGQEAAIRDIRRRHDYRRRYFIPYCISQKTGGASGKTPQRLLNAGCLT